MQLAEQAKQLAETAAANPSSQSNLTSTTATNPQPFDWLLVVGIVVIVIICGVGYYLIYRKPPKRGS